MEFEDVLENENKEFMPEESVDYSATKKIMQGILNQGGLIASLDEA